MQAHLRGFEKPVYLHFLACELCESVGIPASEIRAARYLKALILGTAVQMYCPWSALWETRALPLEAQFVVLAGAEAEALTTLAHETSFDEFVASHHRLYVHDAERYPAYFAEERARFLRSLPAGAYKPTDTTVALEKSLRSWATTPERGGAPIRAGKALVASVLERREHRAITMALFRQELPDSRMEYPVIGVIQRQIAVEYARHYCDESGGDITTGIPGLGFYDEMLTTGFPLYDLPLINWLLTAAGLQGFIALPANLNKLAWRELLEQRGWGDQGRLASHIRAILTRIGTSPSFNGPSTAARRGQMVTFLRGLLQRHQVAEPERTSPSALVTVGADALGRLSLRVNERLDPAPAAEPGNDTLVPMVEVDSFAAASGVTPAEVESFANPLDLPESVVKVWICRILGEPYIDRDWGGEDDDIFTSRVMFRGREVAASFVLKGSGLRGRLTPSRLGKNGDQIVRMMSQPARLFIVQHVGQVAPSVRTQLSNAILARRARGDFESVGTIWDGVDMARLFVAHGLLTPSGAPRLRQVRWNI